MKMRKLQFFITCFAVLTFIGCTVDDRDTSFVAAIPAPSNVSAAFSVTQDNTGTVTITPNGEGATSFDIAYGDGSGNTITLDPGESTVNIYEEGTYEIGVIATGINGLTTEVTQQLVVSFQAPQNLVVTIENDGTLTKTVNINATADFAISYDVDFGETGSEIVSSNIGEGLSYTYQEAGVYTISVTVYSAAIETTTYTEDFEVTAILQPIAPAAASPDRDEADYISIYSDVYTNIAGTDYYPNWGQTTTFNEIDVDGDNIIQYGALTYQGIQFGETAGASSMEFLHVDIWTADEGFSSKISPISAATGEVAFDLDLTANQWNSFDIPLSFFTDQGLSMADIIQFKFDGIPSGEGTIFVDNLYFYKEPTGTITSMVEDFEGVAPTFIVFGNIAATEVISNPDPAGINSSANVAQFTKTAGAEVWAGTFFEIPSALDFVTYNKINVKTWSPVSGAVVKLKLENIDASIVHEVDLNTTVTNAWENLLYDFSAAPVADYVRIVIFFDFGNSGDDSIYYFDDIELVNNDGGPAPLGFQDFEGTPPSFIVFGNIADTQVISNPDPSGVNTTANVAQLTKTAGAEVWAGTFFETASPLDLTTYSKISVKTWSPNNGVVKLKLENADASIVHEVDLNPSVTGAWEELVYDFSGAPVADYVRVVIFFDFGNSGDDSLYYFDEFTLTN